MSDLDGLLIRWQDGSITDAQLTQLKALLGNAAARAELVRHVHLCSTIIETLRGEISLASAMPGTATKRMRAVGDTMRAGSRTRSASHPQTRSFFHRIRSVIIAAAAMLVIAAALVYRHARPVAMPALATITDVSQPASAFLAYADAAGHHRHACTPGMVVHAGDHLDTAGGDVQLCFTNEATTLSLRAGTNLVLREIPGRREVLLEAGSIDASVAKQPHGRALVFITTQAEAWVVGTRLALIADDTTTRLHVSEGLVRFHSRTDATSLDVAANDTALATATGLHRADPPKATVRLLPAHGCLWGVSLRSEAQAASRVTNLESRIGRPLAVVHQYEAFTDYDGKRLFPTAVQRSWSQGGRLLAIAWKPRIGNQQLRWSDVAAGRYDSAYVDVLARKAAAWGHPFFLAIHHDPEESVDTDGSGMTTADYVHMWRHIHDRFALAGADQVAWTWTMSGAPTGVALWNACYPGDAYVDWLACTAYNNSHSGALTDRTLGTWRSFGELITPFVTWVRGPFRGDHSKPIMIAVYACAEDPVITSRKESWLRSIPTQLKHFPEIRALLYFHDRSLRIDSSTAALAGFRAAGADPRFLTEPTASPPTTGGPGVMKR
jgi:ferric-dicitrate binding protein FerR (iron transport regulator)